MAPITPCTRSITAPRSTGSSRPPRPSSCRWRVWCAAVAAAIRLLLGTHPVQRHSPPSRSRSTRATRAPRAAPAGAATSPAEPPPTMTRSYRPLPTFRSSPCRAAAPSRRGCLLVWATTPERRKSAGRGPCGIAAGRATRPRAARPPTADPTRSQPLTQSSGAVGGQCQGSASDLARRGGHGRRSDSAMRG